MPQRWIPLHLDGLEIRGVVDAPHELLIQASSGDDVRPCPRCDTASPRVHSHYLRWLDELPIFDQPVRIQLTVRRFFCAEETCPQRIFAERFPEITAPHARRTSRLEQALQRIVVAVGSLPGARLATRLRMPSSATTLLRLITRVSCPQAPTPRVLGVDDWAIRKGQTYATVLVDLEMGTIIDLLPDRKSETLAAWLREHPGVEIISRDRGGAYAKGAREGAPLAEQVADRWHLVHNLASALERLMHRHHEALRTAAEQIAGAEMAPPKPEVDVAGATKKNKRLLLREQRRQARQARYELIKERVEHGDSINRIAGTLGMSPRTVRNYLRNGVPQWRRPRSISTVDPYDDYLRERWQQGCHNAHQLWRELKEKDFEGSVNAVKRYVKPWRVSPKAPPSKKMVELTMMTARQAVWLLIRTQKPLSEEKQTFRTALFQASPLLKKVATHVEFFQELLAGRCEKTLSWWMEQARELCPELSSFATGLKQDQRAVENAISMPWSQGPTEGHVNRIKTLKRQMYGRAGLELLRRRLILAH